MLSRRQYRTRDGALSRLEASGVSEIALGNVWMLKERVLGERQGGVGSRTPMKMTIAKLWLHSPLQRFYAPSLAPWP